MSTEEIRNNLATFAFENGKGWSCGYGIYNVRFSHYAKTLNDAADWAESENRKLAAIA